MSGPQPSSAVQPVDMEDVDIGTSSIAPPPPPSYAPARRKSIAELIMNVPAAVLSKRDSSSRRSATSSYQDDVAGDSVVGGDGRLRQKRSALVSNFLQQLQLDVVIRKSKVESLEGDSSNVGALRVLDIKTRVGDWNLDEVYRVKNLRILLNAVGGLALALFELYVSWMNKVIIDDDYNVIAILDVPTSRLSNWLKIAMTVLSVLLVVQIGDLYRQFFDEKFRWERAVEQETPQMQNTLFPKTRASSQLTVHNVAHRASTWVQAVGATMKKYLTSSLTWSCLAEMTIAIIHPPPYVDSIIHLTAACLMFFRLYLICRVYRDYSKVYRQRRDILMNCFLHTTNPTFDWFLSIKIDFGKSPLQFILTLFFCVLFILTVCIHVFEREYQPQVFTMTNSVWYTFCTLTTHGLVDIGAVSLHGRFVTAVMLLWGITCETMIVVAILDNFSLNDHGRMVSVYLKRLDARQTIEHVASRAMSCWWKWKQARRGQSPREESAWRSHFWHAMERLGPARTKHVDLEQDEGNPVLEKLMDLELSVAQLANRVDLQRHVCLCRRQSLKSPPQPKHDDLTQRMAALRETQAKIDDQSRTISMLLAKAAAATGGAPLPL